MHTTCAKHIQYAQQVQSCGAPAGTRWWGFQRCLQHLRSLHPALLATAKCHTAVAHEAHRLGTVAQPRPIRRAGCSAGAQPRPIRHAGCMHTGIGRGAFSTQAIPVHSRGSCSTQASSAVAHTAHRHLVRPWRIPHTGLQSHRGPYSTQAAGGLVAAHTARRPPTKQQAKETTQQNNHNRKAKARSKSKKQQQEATARSNSCPCCAVTPRILPCC